MPTSTDEIANSLRTFKLCRDSVLHEDSSTFQHHFDRFMQCCESDPLVRSVIESVNPKGAIGADEWWKAAQRQNGKIEFPLDSDDEFLLRYQILSAARQQPKLVISLGIAHYKGKEEDWVSYFRALILRPFADELSYRLGRAADVASPEARVLQAVPLIRIPGKKELKIFLSHKSPDKPLVKRYFDALNALAFEPWLDERNMAAGFNLEREIFRGFEESCAAVFFLTEHFVDEKYLAAEIDYAVQQKRKKDRKFAIITLRYPNAAPVPGLLTPYIYKEVTNDLEGFTALIDALPIEMGPIRWKKWVVE